MKRQIESEFVDSGDGQILKSFLDLPKLEQQSKLKERLKKYCQKVYLSPVSPGHGQWTWKILKEYMETESSISYERSQ